MTKQQSRHEKGLCFWCDKKFSLNHKCPNRHFMLYQLEGNDETKKRSNEFTGCTTEDEGVLQ